MKTVQHFFDENSNTFSYIIHDNATHQCAIIDSVLDFDVNSGSIHTTLADLMVDYIQQNNLQVEWILETHIHADHLSAASYLKSKLGGKIAISHQINTVKSAFSPIYNVDFKTANSMVDFDCLFYNNQKFSIGTLPAVAIATPGHTPACMSFLIDDVVFVGDTLFMPDYGTARCDFPKGSAKTLYQSIQKLYQLPDETVVYLCHDYLPKGRGHYAYQTTIGEQKQNNIHIHKDVAECDFIHMRETRDQTLSMPRLLLPSIQVNLRAGKLPEPENNGVSYLKIPVNIF